MLILINQKFCENLTSWCVKHYVNNTYIPVWMFLYEWVCNSMYELLKNHPQKNIKTKIKNYFFTF